MPLPNLTEIRVPTFARWHELADVETLDGDTIAATIVLGCDCVLRRQRIRLRGIDAPEHDSAHPASGLTSQRNLDRLLAAGRVVMRLHSGRRDRYARWLADVYTVDGDGRVVWINRQQVTAGQAVEI